MSGDLDETHDAARQSWIEGAGRRADFPIQNLPLGMVSTGDGAPRGGVRIGDRVVDLTRLSESGVLDGDALVAARAACGPTLNPLLALGAQPRRALRRRLSALLSDPRHRALVEPMLLDIAQCRLHLPAAIGDYTDFYVGIHHATNIGLQFRPDNPLLPNYKHVPIGYHGRASSVRASGEPVRRPTGQTRAPDADGPVFGPSRRLDYELELGVWIGPGNALGEPIGIANANAQIAGLCLLNDWSARDIQAWEYQPLGPFLAKNFLTSVSPWIITAEALAPFRVAQSARPEGDPEPLPYLWNDSDQAHGAYALTLEVSITSALMRDQGLTPHRLSQAAASNMYWTLAQMIAHHTASGCNLRPGDLLGTGTISGPTDDGLGSLMELSRGGRTPITLPTSEIRSFLEDGDEVIFNARAQTEGFASIGFGECRGVVVAALPG